MKKGPSSPMLKRKFAVVALLLAIVQSHAQTPSTHEPFRWGAASAAYQVEGAPTADNKGKSIWDVYLDDDHLAGPGISGAVAINFYDRAQYLKDIALLKQMGLTSYRFSISWPRILPDGLGPVNPRRHRPLPPVHHRPQGRRHPAHAHPLPLGYARLARRRRRLG